MKETVPVSHPRIFLQFTPCLSHSEGSASMPVPLPGNRHGVDPSQHGYLLQWQVRHLMTDLVWMCVAALSSPVGVGCQGMLLPESTAQMA